MEDEIANESESALQVKSLTIQEEILDAAQQGNLEQMKYLLHTDHNLILVADDDGYTPLHRACYSDHYNIVKELLLLGSCTTVATKDGWQPLHCAAHWNCLEVASLLLHAGANINACTEGKQTVLHVAAFRSDTKDMLTLLLSMPHVWHDLTNSSGDTAEQLARRKGKHWVLFNVSKEAINKV